MGTHQWHSPLALLLLLLLLMLTTREPPLQVLLQYAVSAGHATTYLKGQLTRQQSQETIAEALRSLHPDVSGGGGGGGVRCGVCLHWVFNTAPTHCRRMPLP